MLDLGGSGDKKASCGYCGRKGKHMSPDDFSACAERCGKRGKKNHFARVCKQKATSQLHELKYSEE